MTVHADRDASEPQERAPAAPDATETPAASTDYPDAIRSLVGAASTIARLERTVADLRARAEETEAERDRLAATIERVRA